MIAEERRKQIAEMLRELKSVKVSALSEQFGVSEETIRRDLARLDEDGIAIKSYGGAVLNETGGIDLPFNVRTTHNIEGKMKIAELAAGLVRDGEHIVLDASSTAVYIAKALKAQRQNLTVITNSIEILIELSDRRDWNVISTGGRVREEYFALMGPRTAESLFAYTSEKLLFSCKGIDMDRGIMEGSEDVVETKKAMMYSASMRILAADASKFGRSGFARVGPLKDLDMIITDRKPEAAWLDYFSAHGIELLYPEL